MQSTLTIQNYSRTARVDLFMTPKVSVVIGAIAMTLLTSGIAAAAAPVIAGDVDCELNQFLNQNDECIPNRECAEIDDIVTDRCQPMNSNDWPDGECPYGLVLGADDGCWHVEGYPIPEDHQRHHEHNDGDFVSPETCEGNKDHSFCWDNVFAMSDLSQYGNNKQVDCVDNPDHPFCNGKRGQDGYIFCELRDALEDDLTLSCWDNDDVPIDDPRAYCATNPNSKEVCKIN